MALSNVFWTQLIFRQNVNILIYVNISCYMIGGKALVDERPYDQHGGPRA